MNNDTKAATEKLIEAMAVEMLRLGQTQYITVKRIREITLSAQLRALKADGLKQSKIVACSGYTRKWIRKKLGESIAEDSTNPIDRFVSDWAADPQFPDTLPIKGDFPSFQDLYDKYGGDFTAPSLLEILVERGIVTENDGYATLDPGREVTAAAGVDMIRAAQCSMVALSGTLRHNLSGTGEPRTERRMWSPSIPFERLPEVRAEVRIANAEHRRRILNILAKYQTSQGDSDSNRFPTVGVGIYWYEMDDE